MTTCTRPISMSNNQRASIISSPLLNSVAESIVIFRPMTQDGCLSARSRVMFGKSSFGVCRKGPPEAVSQSLRTEADGLPKEEDRKSTRLNSSHTVISYAVFCLKKKNHADHQLL